MTLSPACDSDQRLLHEAHEGYNTAKIREHLNSEDDNKDSENAQREQLSLEEIPSLPQISGKPHRKCPTHDSGFLEHDVLLFSCEDDCKNPMPNKSKSVVTNDGNCKRSSETANKVGGMKSTTSVPKAQTQEEKLRERSRKGRERSLRTRRRNIARLKLLEENCVHLSRENRILRELARSLAEQDDEKADRLFNEYRLVMEQKPEAHKLMHPESYYMSLLSPLSVTEEETEGIRKQNVSEPLLSVENSGKFLPCDGVNGRLNGKNRLTEHESMTAKAPSQLNLNESKPREGVEISALGDSVFADPGYDDGKQLGFSLEQVCNEALLTAEEIVELLEQGARWIELPSL